MPSWTKEELAASQGDENLYISIPDADGVMHEPTWIWIVQSGDYLYTRAYNGTNSRWYKAAKLAGHGHGSTGGVEKDVTFEFPTDTETLDAVDEGYKIKYAEKYSGSYLEPMLGEKQRATTVRLLPN